MNNFNFQAMMEHGFLIIPKALLQQQIEDPNIEAGEIEALLKILMKVNYSTTRICRDGLLGWGTISMIPRMARACMNRKVFPTDQRKMRLQSR